MWRADVTGAAQGSLCYLIESAKDLIGICIELNGVAARGVDLCAKRGELILAKQIAAMVLDAVVGVLEGVAGEQKHHRLRRIDLPCRDEFFQSSQRDGGCRFTSDAFGSDLGFGEGDLGFRYLLDPAAGCTDDADGFAPRGGIANADGAGAGVGLDGGEVLPIV